jgi:fluoride ion exporter CrcB/FEX
MALFTPFHFVAIAVGAALGAWLRCSLSYLQSVNGATASALKNLYF